MNTPGTGSGGGATGGVGVGMGGSGFGMAGVPIGTAGAAVGAGGTTAAGGAIGTGGQAVSDFAICSDYCGAYTTACPGPLEQATCSKLCLGTLASADSDCVTTKRDSYLCMAPAMRQASSCNGALALASKICGAVDGQPPPCPDPACEVSIYGDGTGCHATTICGGNAADLQCSDTGGPPLCSCWLNGKKVTDLLSPFDNAKSTCIDDKMRAMCAQYLP